MFTLKFDIMKQVNEFYQSIAAETYFLQTSMTIVKNEFTNNNAGNSSNNKTKTTFVGVHVRRGDMITEVSKDFGYGTGDIDYIQRAMLHYVKPRRFDHVTFVVASDDIVWCQANIKLTNQNVSTQNYRIVFSDRGYLPIVDLGILSACNHSIITGGTFGWWSAFLAGGEAVYYTGYPRRGSELEKAFSESREDFWLPDWIGMD